MAGWLVGWKQFIYANRRLRLTLARQVIISRRARVKSKRFRVKWAGNVSLLDAHSLAAEGTEETHRNVMRFGDFRCLCSKRVRCLELLYNYGEQGNGAAPCVARASWSGEQNRARSTQMTYNAVPRATKKIDR